jgi:hypothetical protein
MPDNLADKPASPRSTTLAFTPRGLRRGAAARYLGISPSLFDRKRKEGEVPSPKVILGVTVWDRADLDRLFGDVTNDNEWLCEPNPWDNAEQAS